jgi:hypothetical protein
MVADAYTFLVTHLKGELSKMRHKVFRLCGGADRLLADEDDWSEWRLGWRVGQRMVKTRTTGSCFRCSTVAKDFGLAGPEVLEMRGKRKLGWACVTILEAARQRA